MATEAARSPGPRRVEMAAPLLAMADRRRHISAANDAERSCRHVLSALRHGGRGGHSDLARSLRIAFPVPKGPARTIGVPTINDRRAAGTTSTQAGLRAGDPSRLAQPRRELGASALAIIGGLETAAGEARRLGLAATLVDLERALGAAKGLLGLLDRLPHVDPGAEATDEDATALASRLRHDLRTPMSAIIGNSEMALEELDGPGVQELRSQIEVLLAEAAHLLSRIDAVADALRRDAGRGAANPRAIDAPVADAAGPRSATGAETGRILIVEDDESNRDLLHRRLVREGHDVVAADSGRAGLKLLAAEAVDLILLDLIMPDIDGFTVLQRLKADERLREIPVIMISGSQEIDSVIRCIEAGAEDYLPKPFNPVLLRTRINACLERKHARDRERGHLARLEAEKARADALLRSILPDQIVARLNDGEVIADRFDAATILFCDLVGFTELAARTPPARMVDMLERLFSAFDALCRDLGIEKIKTIGDAYMAAAGVPVPRPDHAEAIAELGLGMLDAVAGTNRAHGTSLQVRIGAHSGPVVAGIIGKHRFIYDVWGDTVNVANRLESSGVPGRVQVSTATGRALETRYDLESRGSVHVKGKGRMPVFLIASRKSEPRP